MVPSHSLENSVLEVLMGSDDLYKRKRELKEFKRRVGTRGKDRDLILIVCEGEKTEPYYFKGFRLTNVTVIGTGFNTQSLVERAYDLKTQAIVDKRRYDQVWCVFDRDSFNPESYNNAFFLADKYQMRVAYSNEAFEIWYLLHFNYYDAALSRDQYIDKLSHLLGHKYEKNSPLTYNEIYKYQDNAIQRAVQLRLRYSNPNPEKDNPSTTVHLLIQELKKWI